jgi:hypothetical protein
LAFEGPPPAVIAHVLEVAVAAGGTNVSDGVNNLAIQFEELAPHHQNANHMALVLNGEVPPRLELNNVGDRVDNLAILFEELVRHCQNANHMAHCFASPGAEHLAGGGATDESVLYHNDSEDKNNIPATDQLLIADAWQQALLVVEYESDDDLNGDSDGEPPAPLVWTMGKYDLIHRLPNRLFAFASPPTPITARGASYADRC